MTALVALPDNQHALSASLDADVKLFNVNDGTVVRTFKHHTDSVWCLALMPDGRRFVSGSEDGTARIAYHGLAGARDGCPGDIAAEFPAEAADHSVGDREAMHSYATTTNEFLHS